MNTLETRDRCYRLPIEETVGEAWIESVPRLYVKEVLFMVTSPLRKEI
jgi:hypothetical protein